MPRISGSHFAELRKVLRNALDEGMEISFIYHDKPRLGLLTDIGFGKQGAFITLEENDSVICGTGESSIAPAKRYRSYSIVKIRELKTLVMA